MNIPDGLKQAVKRLSRYGREGISIGYGIPSEITDPTEKDLSVIFYVRGSAELNEMEAEVGDVYDGWPVYYQIVGDIWCSPT